MIPFFSLLIKDIYFLNEGCANRLPNGHVNFEVRSEKCSYLSHSDSQRDYLRLLACNFQCRPSNTEHEVTLLYLSGMILCLQKFLELAKQVGEFITWKQVECPFEQDPNIIHYLHTAPIFTEDGKTVQSFITENISLYHY